MNFSVSTLFIAIILLTSVCILLFCIALYILKSKSRKEKFKLN